MTDGDSPFLIPPPPGGVPKPEPAPAKAEPVQAERLIGLPPGVLDSGTYRMPTPRVPVPARLDDAPAFFPAGGPPAAPPAEPPVAAAPADSMPTHVVDDATRASVGRRSAPAWRVSLPGGHQLLVERTTLIGRDPSRNDQWPDAGLLPVIDPAKTVSKTHAALELTATGTLLVHDLDSTNGVYLSVAEGDPEVVAPGAPALAGDGAIVHLGEFALGILRA